jgi:hypothetical protein
VSYIPLPTDVNNNVMTTISQQEIFGQIVIASRTNQITAGFFQSNTTPADFATISTTGGGTATSGNGKALFQTGTGTTSSCTASSFTNISYTPGFEIYSMFTFTFTPPTSASSTQFGGLWDITNNGFYIGYNGTTFGTAKMTAGVQTFTSRASWNGDPLDGSATSRFTRNGVPEAINLTYLNLFRIRFGWLGAAPILYEVCSPDGEWVVFNTILEPNLTANTSITNPNLPVSVQITKTSADATNLAMTCACWSAGTAAPTNVDIVNYNQQTWTSATPANTAVVASVIGAGSTSFSAIITGTISVGVVAFEATPDGVNWFPMHVSNPFGLPSIITTYDLVSGSVTLQHSVGGYIQVRMRLSTAITGGGNVKIEIRPATSTTSQLVQVIQPTGTNLHAVVDKVSLSGNAPVAVAVGTSSGTVLASNVNRKGAVFTNTSTNTISFGLSGNAAVLNSGITLAPYGSWIMDDFTFTTGAITAIAGAAASNLSVQELQ